MTKRLRCWLVALALGMTMGTAHAATDFTDTWWNPAESGWGVNLTQQNHFIFATFYLYGPNGSPVWYTAQLQRDGTGDHFIGPVYKVEGTWFGAPVWQAPLVQPAGTATFTAQSAYAGTLSYSVDGLQVVKTIERQTMVPINIAGSYRGSVAATRTGCEANGHFTDFVELEVLHSPANGNLRITQFSAFDGLLVCRMEGVAVQIGKLLLSDPASFVCPDFGWNSPARIYNIRRTSTGFEAQYVSSDNGCIETGDIAGVFYR